MTKDGDRTKTVYEIEIPKALRDDPKAIADYLANLASERHGKGGAAYRDQHFMMTFGGAMYEESDPDSKRFKPSQGTFGTYADRFLGRVRDDLEDRIRSINEGNTPRTIGPRKSYGFFAQGAARASIIVMERAKPPKLPPTGTIVGKYEGSREIEGQPHLDFRIDGRLTTIPADRAEIPGKPRIGEEFRIGPGRHGFKLTKE